LALFVTWSTSETKFSEFFGVFRSFSEFFGVSSERFLTFFSENQVSVAQIIGDGISFTWENNVTLDSLSVCVPLPARGTWEEQWEIRQGTFSRPSPLSPLPSPLSPLLSPLSPHPSPSTDFVALALVSAGVDLTNPMILEPSYDLNETLACFNISQPITVFPAAYVGRREEEGGKDEG
jgi:hypothetical protein